jgi:hypothetical protein
MVRTKGHLDALRFGENPSQYFTILKERFGFRLWTAANRSSVGWNPIGSDGIDL